MSSGSPKIPALWISDGKRAKSDYTYRKAAAPETDGASGILLHLKRTAT